MQFRPILFRRTTGGVWHRHSLALEMWNSIAACLTPLSCLLPEFSEASQTGDWLRAEDHGNCDSIRELNRSRVCSPETLMNRLQSSSSKRIPPIGGSSPTSDSRTVNIRVNRTEILFRSFAMLLGPGDAERQHGRLRYHACRSCLGG